MSDESRETKSRVIVTLDEINSDPRSSEKTFQLNIENLGKESISITNLSQYLPEGVEFREVWEKSLLKLEKEYKAVCEDITMLFNDELFFSSKDLIENRKRIATEMMNEIMGGDLNSISGIIRWYIKLLFRPYIMKVIADKFLERYHATAIIVDNYDYAKKVFDSLLEGERTDKNFRKIITTKIEKLRSLEEARLSLRNLSALAHLEPGSTFTEHYVFNFPRNLFSPRKYNLMFEITFSNNDKKEQIRKVSSSVNIVPKGVVLSVVAIIFGVLGALFKVMISKPDLYLLLENFPWIEVVMGSLLAFLIFNVYEYLGISSIRKMSISWRSASLIGFACGLLQENFVEAIKAFFGFPFT